MNCNETFDWENWFWYLCSQVCRRLRTERPGLSYNWNGRSFKGNSPASYMSYGDTLALKRRVFNRFSIKNKKMKILEKNWSNPTFHKFTIFFIIKLLYYPIFPSCFSHLWKKKKKWQFHQFTIKKWHGV